MLVSHLHRFIYTKTIKTASTSTEAYFERFCMHPEEWELAEQKRKEDVENGLNVGSGTAGYESDAGIVGYRGGQPNGKKWFNHMPAKRIKAQLGEEIWNSYFKFSVVRNPYDKMISSFFYANKDQKESSNPVPDFRVWVKNRTNRHVDRNKYLIGDEICVDFIIRYEQLQEGISHVCQELGVPYLEEEMPRWKAGHRNTGITVADFYDDETAAFVESLFEFEIAHFGYSLSQL